MLSQLNHDMDLCRAVLSTAQGESTLPDVSSLKFYKTHCVNLNTLEDYQNLHNSIDALPELELKAIGRYLCRADLFFLLTWGLNRPDAMHPWILERCKEVQADPNGYLDLWARDHYKSTIISFALPIQDILSSHGDEALEKWKGTEVTNCILSHTRPIAKGFLRQIKREFEANARLRDLFPDIIWENPDKEAPKWSEDDGIILKRRSNPKESTLEAWGLVEGQPTSKHFNILTYDDVVTQNSVNTPEMIKKTVRAWEMSVNLGTKETYRRAVGTIYNYNDAYMQFMKRGTIKVRRYPGTKDGTVIGEPVLKTREQLAELYKLMGPSTFASQILLDPKGDAVGAFKEVWLAYHRASGAQDLNVYLLIDPADSKRKGSDYTAIEVCGLGVDGNYYTLDMVRDRLNLQERTEMVMHLHRKWKPLATGYEKVGMQSDIQHIEYVQDQKNYHFKITPLDAIKNKVKRIEQLQPIFARNGWLLPYTLVRMNYEGENEDLVETFINDEYLAFPVCAHEDMLDVKAMILHPDLKAEFPSDNLKVDARKFKNKVGAL